MRTLEYTFWRDGEFFVGPLNEFPDYETQAHSKDELIENLKDFRKISNPAKFHISERSRNS
jgi:hypothetical protein